MEKKQEMLRLEGICKSFPGVKALQDVSFSVQKGEIHCLIGGNGAGKSTLMKILAGAYKKDAGHIWINDKEVEIENPKAAEHMGISIIYQELNLIHGLSVAENIFVGHHPKTKTGCVDWNTMERKTEALLKEFQIELDPKTLVEDISIAQQQMVEIIKAVSKEAQLVIMDEPTSSLTKKEIEVLFEVIRRLKEKDVSVIFISHRLDEIFQISDRVTVMRDGMWVATRTIEEITRNELVSMIIGRKMSQQFPDKTATIGEELLRVENLSDGKKIQDIHFALHAGEVLGFAGLVGAGRTETMHMIFGSMKKKSGKIYLRQKEIDTHSPKKSIENGIGLLTEDRKREGLVLPLTLRENVGMVASKKILKNRLINRKKENEISKKYVSALNIVTPSVEQKVVYLSGGNQQKVVLAKWLLSDCDVIIMDEPTRGIDVGAKREIYDIINQLAAQGKGIIVVSSEFEEVMGICDRIIVMCEGKIKGTLDKKEFSQERITAYAVGEGV